LTASSAYVRLCSPSTAAEPDRIVDDRLDLWNRPAQSRHERAHVNLRDRANPRARRPVALLQAAQRLEEDERLRLLQRERSE
jgi:hypothetical protein